MRAFKGFAHLSTSPLSLSLRCFLLSFHMSCFKYIRSASAFRICRGLEAVGASLRSREHMVYSLDCLRDDFDGVIEYLINVTTAPDVRPWELSDLSPRVKIDKDVADQKINVKTRIMCSVEGAYKNALSNSLYCPDHMLGKISVDHVSDFYANNYTSARMALVGLGVSHAALKQVGEQFFSTHSGVGAPGAKAVYRGGDGGGLVHALLACEGAAAGSAEANAFSVLQRLLGAGPHIKRGSDFTSKLSQGIAKATAQPFDATASSQATGVYVISQADSAREVSDAVAEGRLTADDLTRANKYIGCYGKGVCQCCHQFTTTAYSSPQSVTQSIDSVTSGDIVKVSHLCKS
uniref:Ubiquinol-cytochrome c reductase core protein 2a n=1 Tax=Sinocyclocheilus grahami TaxID=75366 RepID=A0A672P1P6_SINGR